MSSVRDKNLAAKRAMMKIMVLPHLKQADAEEKVPKEKDCLEIILADDIPKILDQGLLISV